MGLLTLKDSFLTPGARKPTDVRGYLLHENVSRETRCEGFTSIWTTTSGSCLDLGVRRLLESHILAITDCSIVKVRAVSGVAR